MTVLIVAAVKEELDLLLSEYGAAPKDRAEGCPCYVGESGGLSLGFGITGIGLASACLTIGEMLTLESPEALILLGSAGALPGSGLEKGDLVVARSETLSELGLVTGAGTGDAKALGLPGLAQEIPMDRGLGDELMAAAERDGRAVFGRVLTVVGVSATADQARDRANMFGAVAENMEGYAAALAARKFGVRTAEVRGISNRAGDRDRTHWDLDTANERAQAAVVEYLRRLS